MENERLRITLDSPEKTYFAGQQIKGEIWMNLAKRTTIRAIKIQLTGKGKCKWMDILHNDSANNRRSLFYSSKEIYVHDENPLSFFEPRGVELGIGEHTFDFIVRLDKNLPSSFKGRYGSIKYKLRVMIQKPWSFDEKHIIPISVVRYILIPEFMRINPIPFTKQITKTISIFGNRPISITSVLPEPFAVRNENIKLNVTVANNSNINVEKLKFSIVQLITFFSFVPLCTLKKDNVVIFQKEAGNVQKKSERTFAHELLVPACQPSDSSLSRVIKIGYEMRVEAVLHGFFKNLVMTLPFTIYSGINGYISGTFPSSSLSLGLVTNVSAGSSGGNPFETTANTTYPQLDTSLSSAGSPSHSSQYSETSSLHSTTSDSSATTLSPAVGGTAISYASDTSSQFNSPAARSSIRSTSQSVVPCVPYSSSPAAMANSYPPPQLPPYQELESPEYTTAVSRERLANALLQNLFHDDDLSAPSWSSFRRRQPPGSSDLPPSYEELFGSATAPPLDSPN